MNDIPTKRIYLSPPDVNSNRLKQILAEVIDENWIAPVGPQLDLLESQLSQLLGSKSVLALNSGTSALHLAYLSAGIKKGDTVIVQSHTHIATVNALRYIGAKPVFVDSEWETLNMCPNYLHEAIADLIAIGEEPVAVVSVNIYGKPALYDAILALCDQYQLTLIEDAAESLGSTWKGKPCGTVGAFAALSFNGNKILTSGGGGALISPSKTEYLKALKWATQSKEDLLHFEHLQIGYNYRLSNVLAAVANCELENFESKLKAKKEVHQKYVDFFSRYPELQLHEVKREGFQENYWLNTLIMENASQAQRLIDGLNEQNIEARPFWKPMHMQPVNKGLPFYGGDKVQTLFERGICLPSGTNYSQADWQRILKTIKGLLD